ncbi:MAG: glycosyltransferase family 39 protein, partial [Bacteroidota bacterium]|nr:glycosyltransferase family 39 protein [Bacteroidota bacterium]
MVHQKLSARELHFFLLILLSAFLIKIILALAIQTSLKSDSITYNTLALSILKGEYSFDGRPTAFVVIGYPLFLSAVYSLFGDGQFFVKIIQSFIEIFTGLLFFRISRIFFNIKYSLFSLGVFSFLPSNLLYSQAILTESLFGFLYMLVIIHCLKENFLSNLFLLGIFLGLAILVRSSFSFAALLIPLFLFFERKRLFTDNYYPKILKHSAIFIAGLFLILAPWLVRNKIVMNSLTLATQGGSTLWEGNNPDATGTWNPQAVNNNPLFKNSDEVYREKEFYRLASNFILENPLRFITLGIKKTGYLFSSERMIILYFVNAAPGETSTQVYKAVNPLILLLVNIPYFIIMMLGAWGILVLKRKTFFIYGFILIW